MATHKIQYIEEEEKKPVLNVKEISQKNAIFCVYDGNEKKRMARKKQNTSYETDFMRIEIFKVQPIHKCVFAQSKLKCKIARHRRPQSYRVH